MPYQAFEASLKKLGLSDKEASVYLAMLSLGPSSVLRISRKAGVARATTYLVLEELLHKGMVSIYEKDGAQNYVAEEPEHLRYLIERRRQELAEEEELLVDIIPKLQAFTWAEDQRPVVRYYHGREGLKTLRSEMLRTSQAGETWYNFTPVDHLYKVFGNQSYTYEEQRLARGVKSKSIFTTKSTKLKNELLMKGNRRIERKFVSPAKFTSGTGITITKDRVALGTMEDKLGGFVVESRSVAAAMRELFELAWKRQD